jgi:hypothetical protein
MKMSSGDALAKIKALNLAGAEPVQSALAEESQQLPSEVGEKPTPERVKPGGKSRNSQKLKRIQGTTSRRSHSKGGAAAIVTGYLDPLHVDVLVDLRSRLGGVNALSIPSANQLLRVALRLVRTLKPTDAQIFAAYTEEQSGE